MNFSNTEPYKDIGAAPATQTVTLEDGTVRTFPTCPMRLNIKMVDPQGNVSVVPLANGFAPTTLAKSPYGMQILAQKMRKGWLPFSECPYAKGHLPVSKSAKPCAGDDGRGGFKRDTCCEHVTAVINARRAKWSASFSRQKGRTSNDLQLLEQLGKQNAMLGEVIAKSKMFAGSDE